MVYPAAKVFADDISLHTIESPSLTYRSFRVDDASGIPNLKLDPGEAADLTLVLRNAGAAAPAVTATLVSRSPFLTVLDAAGAFGPCGQGDTTASSADRFRVEASSSAPVEVPQYCDLFLSGAGYADTLRIPVIVGDSMNLPAGPDAYGYRIYDWTDSCYERRPDYDWLELRGMGTPLTIGDDETRSVSLPPGFGPWRYYGETFDSISICSNGWVAPGMTDRCDFVNVELPYSGSPPNIVAFVWDDLAPSLGGNIWYYHDATGHRFVVEFDSICYFGVPGEWEMVQLQLYDTTVATPTGDNSIDVQFKTVNDFRAATVGLQNRDGTAGLTHVWNENYPRVAAPLRPSRALRFEASELTGLADRCDPSPVFPVHVWPNPFRRSTRLVLAGGRVLAIRDVSGRAVRSLESSQRSGCWEWDGRDNAGRRVAPGTYFAVPAGALAGPAARLVVIR
jgi:hypothetical protein